MKKGIFILSLGIILIAANLFAADGDLVVDGTAVIGQELESTGTTGVTALSTSANVDDVDGSKAAKAAQFTVKHYGRNGRATGARYDILLQYSSDNTAYTIVQEHSAQNNVIQIGNNTGSELTTAVTQEGTVKGATYAIVGRNENNREININGDVNAIDTRIDANGAEGPKAVNMQTARHIYIQGTSLNENWTMVDNIGIEIEKQAAGTNNYGIWLNGDEEGADIVFGTNPDVRIFRSGGALWVDDALGDATQISPHDPETGEWIFYSKNRKTGRVLRVNMEELVKDMEKLTGKKYLIESFIETTPKTTD